MALQLSGAGFGLFHHRRGHGLGVRAMASESVTTVRGDEEKVELGGSDVKVTKLGIGAGSWGDTGYWNDSEWDDGKLNAAKAAFDASIDGGIVSALKASLSRLGLSSVDLYQLHWRGIWGNEGYIDGLGDAFGEGLVKAVGVSNYNATQLGDAYDWLEKRGIPLAANQDYSLIYRNPEENGVKAACDELGVTLIAYSPTAQGILTGKYTPERPPCGPRGKVYTPEYLTKLQPLMTRIKEIGQSYSKTPTQVVLNWLTCRNNVVLIPGAKNAEQAKEFVGDLGWRLTDQEIEELRSLTSKIPSATGLPFE